jgi:hypothetical protein
MIKLAPLSMERLRMLLSFVLAPRCGSLAVGAFSGRLNVLYIACVRRDPMDLGPNEPIPLHVVY